MSGFLRDWILNITIMIVFVVLVEIIVPSDKFKKYVKLVTGLVIMIVIINPVVTVMNKDLSLDLLSVQSFNHFDRMELAGNAEKIDSLRNKQVVEVYKQKLSDQIRDKILTINGTKDANVYINIDEDINSKDFGTILNIDVMICSASEEKNSTVRKIDIAVTKQVKDDAENIELKENIKNVLSKAYEVAGEKINITVQRNEKG